MEIDKAQEMDTLQLPDKDGKQPDKSYVPEGFKEREEYLDDLRKTYEYDIEADDENRKQAVDDKRFAAGEQWDSTVLAMRDGLPSLTINTIPQFTAQLVGDWRENKNAVKVLPVNNGDKDIADIRADLIRSIETKSRADVVYDNAFESMVVCGDGAFRVGVRYTSDDVFDQEIVMQPIDDALSVIWDRLSVDPTGRDASHCYVDDVMPKKEFEKRWPDTQLSELSKGERNTLSHTGWMDQNTVRVTEHWRMIERDRLLVMFEDGTMYSFDEGDNTQYGKMVETHGKVIKSRVAPCRYAQMHVVTGFDILAGPYEWKLSRLPIIRMSGRVMNLGDRRIRYGLVRFMKDAARLRNFWRSTAAEQLGYAPKAQWMATESAVEGKEDDLRKAHLTRDPLLIFNDEAIFDQNVKRMDPPQIQQALLNEAATNTQDMKDITGIHDASLGIKSNETSGKAIRARQQEGDIASLTYYDNGNQAVLEAGDVTNQLIGQIYDGTRIIRIIGEDEAAKLVKINDPNDPKSPNLAVGQYDVAMSTGPSYTTRRQEAADAMMNAVQVYPELMQVAGDLIVKAQEWPGADDLAERLRKTIPPQLLSEKEQQEQGVDVTQLSQQMQQTQEQMQQMGEKLQQTMQENLMLKVKDAAQEEKHRLDAYKAETERLTAYAAILKDNLSINLQQLEQEASSSLEREQFNHQQLVDAANHAKDVQGQQQQAADAQAAREHQTNTKVMDIAHQAGTQAMNIAHQSNEGQANREVQVAAADKAAKAKASPSKKKSTPAS